VNVRRGFNRLFVVAWLAWVLFILGWTWHLHNGYRAYWEREIYEGQHGRPWDMKYRATPAELEQWRRYRDESTATTYILNALSTRDGWFFVVVAFGALPTIVYAVIFGVGWTAGWVTRGFKSEKVPQP
jgi:hypothetical protein